MRFSTRLKSEPNRFASTVARFGRKIRQSRSIHLLTSSALALTLFSAGATPSWATIGTRPQTIEAPTVESQVFGTAPIDLVVTATSQLPVVLTSADDKICTTSNLRVTLVGAGYCEITASQAGDVLWAAAANVQFGFDITSIAPSEPLNVSATPSDGSIVVTWEASASTGGVGIKNYVASTDQGQTCTTSVATDSNPLTCRITGLTNGVAYSISVVAQNEDYPVTPASGPSVAITNVKPGRVPAAPLNVYAEHPEGSGSGDVVIHWDASPDSGGAAIDYYEVNRADSAFCRVDVVTGEEPLACTFVGLDESATYDFVVIAHNAFGSSANSVARLRAVQTTGHQLDVNDNCSITESKTVACWGRMEPGSMGYMIPKDVKNVEQLDMSHVNACIRFTDQSVRCWGQDWIAPSNLAPSIDVAVGVESACSVSTTNTLRCWGHPGYVTVPRTLGKVTDVTMTSDWACATLLSGALRCFRLTDGSAMTVPTGVFNPKKVAIDIWGGACAQLQNNKLKCWGNAPEVPTDLGGIRSFDSFLSGVCAVTMDYSLRCFGGYNDWARISPPAFLPPVRDVHLNQYWSCADLVGGGVRCWGYSYRGQTDVRPVLNKQYPFAFGAVNPSAPREVTALGLARKVKVSWSAPETIGQGKIVGYRAIDRFSNSNCVVVVESASTPLNCEIPGLTNGTDASIEVVAYTTTGQSADFADADRVVVKPVQVTSMPRNVRITSAQSRLDVVWDTPEYDGGAPITGYRVVASPGGASCTTTRIGSDLSQQCSIYGLTNKTEYSISVEALNVAGYSEKAVVVKSAVAFAMGSHSSSRTYCAIDEAELAHCWGWTASVQDVPADLGRVIDIALTQVAACAVTVLGEVRCWGDNAYGVLNVPSGMGVVKRVYGSQHFSMCALNTLGKVKCWGVNENGQTNVPADLGEVADMKLSLFDTCAVLVDHTVRCWGAFSGANFPEVVNVESVSMFYSHFCAVRIDHSLTCNGFDSANQLQDKISINSDFANQIAQVVVTEYDTCVRNLAGSVMCAGPTSAAILPTKLEATSQLYSNVDTMCATELDKNIVCWGADVMRSVVMPKGEPSKPLDVTVVPNAVDQSVTISWKASASDEGDPIQRYVAFISPSNQSCEQVSVPGQVNYSCIITNIPQATEFHVSVVAWNGYGKSLSASNGVGNSHLVSIDSGSCMLTSEGTPICWSQNPEFSRTPHGLTGLVDLAANVLNVCGLDAQHVTHCWGHEPWNSMNPATKYLDISMSAGYGCGVLENHTVECWGGNYRGASSPPEGLIDVQSISTGSNSACAILMDDSAVCWGGSEAGMSPVPSDLGTVKKIASGNVDNCAITMTDQLRCWGYGTTNGWYGSLVNIGTVSDVYAENDVICVVLPDHSAKCAGDGNQNRTSPPDIKGGYSTIVGTVYHVCGLTYLDQQPVCWGYNDDRRSEPVSGLSFISKTSQTIAINPIDDYDFNVAQVSFGVQSSSGLTPTMTTLDSSICHINENYVVFDAAGDCAVKATQAGNDFYEAAEPVTETLTIRPIQGDATQNVTATAGRKKVTVNWTPVASTGGLPVLKYIAHTDEGHQCEVVVSGSTLPTTCDITGLINGARYSVGVYAVTSWGGSLDAWAPDSYYPAGVPDAPRWVTAVPGNHQLTVSWAAPADNGNAVIDYYIATASPSGKTCRVDVQGEDRSSCVIKDLTNGSHQTFSVVAHNANGLGDASVSPAPISQLEQGTNGTGSFCAVSHGQVICESNDSNWQPLNVPADLGIIKDLVVSENHACVLNTSHELTCWGDASFNQRPTSSVANVAQFDSGRFLTCAVHDDGQTECWGNEAYVTLPSNLGTLSEVHISGGIACGLRTDHSVICWYDFGRDLSVADANWSALNSLTNIETLYTSDLINQVCAQTFTHKFKCVGEQTNVPDGIDSVLTMDSDGALSCLITLDYRVRCWGSPSNGNDAFDNDLAPVKRVDVGYHSTCVEFVTGGYKCVGYDGDFRRSRIAAHLSEQGALVGAEPSIPTSVTAIYGNKTATVSWSAPTSDGGSAVTAYRVFEQYSNHSCTVIVESSSTPLTCTVTGLNNGQKYGFEVYAYNAIGASSPADPYSGTQIDTNHDTTCVLHDGKPLCWGDTGWGDLLVADAANQPRAIQIAVGAASGCVVTESYMLSCWGRNYWGEMNVPADLGAVNSVWMGMQNTCAVTVSKTLKCWGNNSYGQTDVPEGLTNVVKAVISESQTCAIKENHTATCFGSAGAIDEINALTDVVDLSIWGNNYCYINSANELNCGGSEVRTPPTTLTHVKSIDINRYSNCAIDTNDLIVCWGNAVAPSRAKYASQVALGAGTICALLLDGTVSCWGNADARARVPSFATAIPKTVPSAPVNVNLIRQQREIWVTFDGPADSGGSPITGFRATATPGGESCFVTAVGNGPVGGGCMIKHLNTGTNYRISVVAINEVGNSSASVNLDGTKQLSTGGNSTDNFATCGVRDDGTVRCIGRNWYGILNVPDTITTATQVELTYGTACALLRDKTVTCWGSNEFGGLNVPADLTNVAMISAGFNNTCALLETGSTVCWGANTLISAEASAQPAFSTISISVNSACGITVDGGHVNCWGGSTGGSMSGYENISGATKISVNDYMGCADAQDGLVCWGNESWGLNANKPTSGHVLDIAGENAGMCIVDLEHQAKCWGYNDAGRFDVPADLGSVDQIDVMIIETCALLHNGGVRCWGPIPNASSLVLTGVPTAPQNVNYTVTRESNTVIVNWTASESDGGRSITSYRVRLQPGNQECYVPVQGADTPLTCEFNNVSRRVHNSIQVVAINALGTSPVANPLGGLHGASSSQASSCAIDEASHVQCWGYSGNSFPGSNVSVQSVAMAAYGGCALTVAGRITCWDTDGVISSAVPAESGFTSLAIRDTTACAVNAAAELVCWGYNGYGLALDTPVGLSHVAKVFVGNNAICITHVDGTVECWGTDPAIANVPQTLTNPKDISIGISVACAINTSDHVVCWGAPDRAAYNVPSSLGAVKAISLFSDYACAIRTDGDLQCWGANHQYGNAPQGVYDLKEITISATIMCVVNTAGEAYCSGAGDARIDSKSSIDVTIKDDNYVNLGPANVSSVSLGIPFVQSRAESNGNVPVSLTTSTPEVCSISEHSLTDHSDEAKIIPLAEGSCVIAATSPETEFVLAGSATTTLPIKGVKPIHGLYAEWFNWNSGSFTSSTEFMNVCHVGMVASGTTNFSDDTISTDLVKWTCRIDSTNGVRLRGYVTIPGTPGGDPISVLFKSTADDYSRLFVAGNLVAEQGESNIVSLLPGVKYPIEMWNFNYWGGFSSSLEWRFEGTEWTSIPTEAFDEVGQKRTQAIVWGSDVATLEYEGSVDLAPTTDRLLPVVATLGSEVGCSLLQTTVTATSGTGSCTVNVLQEGDDTTLPATASRIISLTKKSNAISFESPGAKPFTSSSTNVTGRTSSALPITFVSNSIAVCIVSTSSTSAGETSGTVTFVKGGECSITAASTGNENYVSPMSVTRTFQIMSAKPSVTAGLAITSKTKTNLNLSWATPASNGSSITSYSLKYSSNNGTSWSTPIRTASAGTTYSLTGLTGNTNYVIQVAAENINGLGDWSTSLVASTVKTQTLTLTLPATLKVGAANAKITATTNAVGLTVALTSGTPKICTIVAGKLKAVAAGTCKITASQAGNADYSPAVPVTKSMTIKKK